VHEPGKLSAGAAEGASWWLAGILASTPTAVPGGSAPGGASAAASGRDGSSSEEGSASAAERPWWQHTKKAEQTVVAQLRRKGSRALQAFGFQRGRSSSSSSSSYFSGYARGPAVTSGRGRAGGGAVSGGGRRAAPRGSPGLSTRAHTSLAAASTSTSAASTSGSSSDYSSSEASVAAALAGRSSSNGRSGHLRSGAAQTLLREPRVYTSSSSRGGGEVWTDSRTGLTLPLALGPSFDSSEIDSGSSSRDGSGNGEGQVLLGGGAFSKWGMPVYVVGLYAEAASPALAASLVYARATSGTVNSAASEATTGHLSHGAAADTNRSGEGSEGSSRRKRESAEAAYNSDSNCSGHTAVPSPQEPSPSMGEGPHPPPHHGPGQAGRASWLASLDADTLRNDPAFYLALTAPAAYDRTLLLKLAMSVNPRHLQSAMMASWLMPPHHKRRILAATTLGFGGGVDDGSADSSDSTTSSTGSSSGSSDATACCERGTEIAFTWRGRTGALELRVNGQLLYTMREEVALKEASAMLRSSGGSSSWSSSTSSRTHPNGGSLAVDFFGSSSDSSSSASSSKVPHSAAAMAFAAPASNFDDLKVEMDTALKVTGAATSMTSLGHGSSTSRSSGSERGSSSFAHAPFGTSLPRALMYQYLAADEVIGSTLLFAPPSCFLVWFSWVRGSHLCQSVSSFNDSSEGSFFSSVQLTLALSLDPLCRFYHFCFPRSWCSFRRRLATGSPTVPLLPLVVPLLWPLSCRAPWHRCVHARLTCRLHSYMYTQMCIFRDDNSISRFPVVLLMCIYFYRTRGCWLLWSCRRLDLLPPQPRLLRKLLSLAAPPQATPLLLRLLR